MDKWTLLKQRDLFSYGGITRVEIRGPGGSYVHDTVHGNSPRLARYAELVDTLNAAEALARALDWAMPYVERDHMTLHGDNDTAASVLQARAAVAAWDKVRAARKVEA